MGKLNVITGNPQLAQCSLCLLCLLSVILISCFSMLIINMTKDPSNKISALASYASVWDSLSTLWWCRCEQISLTGSEHWLWSNLFLKVTYNQKKTQYGMNKDYFDYESFKANLGLKCGAGYIHNIYLFSLHPAVSSVSARVWRTATDVPSVTILSIMWIRSTQTFLVGILNWRGFLFCYVLVFSNSQMISS